MEREDLLALIQEFKSRIPQSKELAKDVETFLEKLEVLFNEGVFDVIKERLDELAKAKDEIDALETSVKEIETEQENLLFELLNRIQQVIDDSPDAVLRKRITNFLETARNANGPLTENELVRIALQCR